MRRKRQLFLPVMGGLLCVVTLAAAAAVRPLVSLPVAATVVSTYIAAPGTAVTATRAYLDDALSAVQPGTAEAEDYDGGFWTQLPTETEVAAAAPAQVPESTPESAAPESAPAQEEIPEGMAPLISAHYDQGSGPHYIASGAATIKNATDLPASEVAAEMMQALPFTITPNSSEPQVLIMHTHATETYETEVHGWCDPNFSARTTDTALNMVAVGERIAAQLNAAGIVTLHDATLHDYPSYNGSYEKSNSTVRDYLAKNPSIKVVLDIHRDAIQKPDGTRIKPIAEIDGRTAAQVMIICGADLNGNLPNFKQNLRFASRLQNQMESMYPGLTRPVLFDYRYYNQDLTTGSLLLEMGGHANTLEEALYSGDLVGKALAALFTAG